MIQLSEQWLKEEEACEEGIVWFNNQSKIDPISILKLFIETEEHLEWANWLIVRVMDYNQYVSYAIYSAEQVIDIYEKEYPDDKRPREAIEAAKKCLENPTEKNKASAASASAYASAAYASASAKKQMQIKILKYGLQLLGQ